MKIQISAPGGYLNQRRGIDAKPGDVIDVSEDLAVKLLNNRLAVPAPKPERKTAAHAPSQNVAKHVGKAPAASKVKEAKNG